MLSPATAPERLVWPDVAKGLCILLVVLHHLIAKHYVVVLPDDSALGNAWHTWTDALKPLRMPVFFVISGYFAATAITRPWAASARRILGSYYLYVVWLLVFFGVYAVERTLPANRTNDLAELGGDLLWSATSMWFLYALAVYFALAKALRRWPVLVLAAAAGQTATVSWLEVDEANRAAVLAHFVYFALGAYFPRLVTAVVERRVPLRLLMPLYLGAVLVVIHEVTEPSVAVLAAGVVGIPLGLTLAARLAPTSLGAPLAWLGRRTLRVYVLHLLVLAAVVNLPVGPVLPGLLGGVVAAVYPVVMGAVVVAACFGAHALLVRSGAGWLFEVPRRASRQPLPHF